MIFRRRLPKARFGRDGLDLHVAAVLFLQEAVPQVAQVAVENYLASVPESERAEVARRAGVGMGFTEYLAGGRK